MNHPDPGEWVPFLFGEAKSDRGQQLKEHLRSCPDCRDEVNAWKRSLGRLHGWKLPTPEKPPAAFAPGLRWAIAGVLVLGLGLGLGRLTAPASLSPGELRAQVAAEVKTALAPGLPGRLGGDLAADVRSELAQARRETSNSLAALEARLTEATEAGAGQLLQSVAEALQQGRAEDRRTVLALFRELEQEQAATYVALRKDLETLASLTDDELRQARLRLIELAADAVSQPVP
jgi:hypothetical protein